MAGMAKVILIGNVGRDPEMRFTPSGAPVTSFTVAVNRRYKGQDGEQREETEWFSVDCWNRLAEVANEYLQKGKQVYIEGRIRIDTWDDRNTGEKRARLKVTATDMQMLGSRDDQGAGGQFDRSPGVTENAELDNMPF